MERNKKGDSNNMTLYEIKEDFQRLFQTAEEEEITDEVLKDTLESLQYDLEDKADQYAKIIKELEGQAKVIDDERQRLDEKKRTITNNITRMKTALKDAMKVADKKKIKTDLFTFSVRKASNRSVEITGEVPKEYLKAPEPNTMAIKELLKTQKVEWAYLKEPTEFLSIR